MFFFKKRDLSEKEFQEQQKMQRGLEKTRTGFFQNILNTLTHSEIDDDLYNDLEEQLILADVGPACAVRLVDELRDAVEEQHLKTGAEALEALRGILCQELTPRYPLELDGRPAVILVIGVNGVGKTTTIAKLAHLYKEQGRRVMLAAGDTFRAAATEQLEVWAGRAGVPLIKHKEGADPAAVVFDTIAAAKARDCDVIICDTAGRLHNKKNLMDELGKISRVIDRELPGCDRETLLVLDAATGQNAVNQAREFQSAAGITGIVLTKLDGTPKGGVVLPIMQDLGLPVKFIGVGEQVDDLQPFDPDAFADALFDVQREEAPVIKEDRTAWEEERREEERLLEEQARAEAEAAAVEEEQPEPWEEEPAPVEEAPQEEPQPEKKKRRFWPFGRKRDEE